MSKNAMDDLVKDLETGETPDSQNSQSDGQSNSPGSSSVDLTAIAKALAKEPELRKIVESIARSDKDKGIAKAMNTATEALKVGEDARAVVTKFQDYLEKFGSEERALFEMERDARIDSLIQGEGSTTQEPASAGTDTRPWGVRQREILESAGLDPKDPRARELAIQLRDEGKGPEEYLAELSSKTFEWTGTEQQPNPSISSVMNPSKGTSQRSGYTPEDLELLGAELIELSVNYSANKGRIAEINKILEENDQGE